MLLTFLKEKGYEVFRQNKEIIIVTNGEDFSFNKLWTRTITFIVSGRAVYLNVVKSYPKLNPPVLFSHLLLKHDLKKFIAGYERRVTLKR